jgi:rhodanese-related sulfurtransferase
MKVNTLNHISILFFSFVMVLMLVNLFTTNNYGKANSQVLEHFQHSDYIMDFFELHKALNEPESDYAFIDLRSADRYQEGHIPGAINIPFENLLTKNNQRKIKREKSKIPVLYASAEHTAHTARMLLLAKGFDSNIKVMAGDYEKALAWALEQFDPAFASYRDEKAKFDYRRFMQQGIQNQTQTEQNPGSIPGIKTQTLTVQGGC